MSTKKKKKKIDHEQILVDRVIAAMENCGSSDWTLPWVRRSGSGPLRNAVSGHQYTGGNVLLLNVLGGGAREWASFRQWKTIGASVKKGEKGTPIRFPMNIVVNKDAVKERGDDEVTRTFFKYAYVFSPDQVDGYEPEHVELPDVAERLDKADAFLERVGPNVKWGVDQAAFNFVTDQIQMPDPEQFLSTEKLYSTMFHELTHWTGHESRLKRKLKNPFGSKEYAYEELIAELGSYFIAADFDLDTALTDDAAAYLKHWTKMLKDDKTLLLKAAAAASKAKAFMEARAGVTRELVAA